MEQSQNPEEAQDTGLLLEQYKLYVDMMDRISNRRTETNKFYTTLLTALFAVLSFTIDQSSVQDLEKALVLLMVSVLGIVFCYIWVMNIRSYKQINAGKFEVIHGMESKLPYPCYKQEWEILGKGKIAKNYLHFTRVEQLVPIVLAIPYLALFVYSIYKVCVYL